MWLELKISSAEIFYHSEVFYGLEYLIMSHFFMFLSLLLFAALQNYADMFLNCFTPLYYQMIKIALNNEKHIHIV